MNVLINSLAKMGARPVNYLARMGQLSLFTLALLRHSIALLRRPTLWLRAMWNAGVLSLPIILVSGLFVGMVLALQAYVNMKTFGAETSTSLLVALSLMRELGSVVTALLFAGRAGSALTAEIGLMNTTEQLAAMEIMGIEPIAQVGVPRFYGALLSLPLLAILFVAVAMLGAYLVGVGQMGLDAGSFWSQLQRGVDFYHNVFLGVIVKSLVFSFLCAAVAVYEGFAAPPTAQGLGQATTRTVVISSLLVLAADFLLTSVMFGI